jgi:aryl-alcohol dehydrogenase-like predicted oxidoreductase
LHNPSDLRTKYGEKIYKKLEQLKNEKLINNIGISVYTPSTLINIINEFKIDVVQFPLNILDNRFNTKYIHDELESQSINIYLRSIFLQGLLVTKSINHHNYFSKWKFIFLKWENWLNQNKLSPVDVCVNYALSVFKKAKVIVGVSSLNDLREISVACDQNIPHIPKEFWCSDIELVDPRKWKI